MPRSLPGTLGTTRHLLDGAIAAGERTVPTSAPRALTERSWATVLVDQWYTAHHGVSLLPAVIRRYESMRRPELARFARRKLDEEAGHDRLPLNDLRALGYDAEAAVEEVPPGQNARALVAFARECVYGPHPVSFFGYIYAFERRVIRITEQDLRALERVLPAGVEAASGLKAHAFEFDRGHVEELVEFIARLPGDDRTEIALACHTTATICVSPAPNHADVEREKRMSRFSGTRPL
jgi:pyrroloquinoline quinone (PQQ) biosynthesis protein C